jgi:tetratricopeptide (TPR) repeat protein
VRLHLQNSFLFAAVMVAGIACMGEASSLDEANKAYLAGDYRSAIKLFRTAAIEGESPALCYYNAANACFQIDSLAQAVVLYRACIQNAPEFLKGHLNLAICYYTLNDLGHCLATIESVLDIEPTHQKALLLKAAALRRCGATAKATVTFENIIRLYPEQEEPYIALGEIYRDLDDQDEAIHWLEAYPAEGKNRFYVVTLLADLYEKKGDIARAIYELGKAFAIDKNSRWTLYRIALLQQQSGKELVALETCREGTALFPDFADMASLGGSIAFDHNRIDDAERFFEQGAALGSSAAVVGLTNIRNWRKAQPTDTQR